MKVKIRGLVFVGFAAAVFAQSAMAEATADAKTVTSKLYVDTKFQDQSNRLETSGTGNAEATTITDSSTNAQYPSARNVYKFVTTTVSDAAITVADDDAGYVSVSGSNGAYTVGLEQAPVLAADAVSGLTGTLSGTAPTKLVTAGAVNALIDTGISGTETNNTVPTSLAVQTYAEAAENKLAYSGGETITANKTSDIKFPTAKNVYEFVTTQGGNYQPKVTTANSDTMYIGKYVVDSDPNTAGDQSLATWDSLADGTYVTGTSSNGVYTLDIPAAKITSGTSDFVASNGSNDATRAKLATSGTVYDFVNGGYQVKATSGVSTVEVGHDGGWTTLAGGDSYVNVAYNSASGHTQAEVTLTNIGTHGVAWTDGNSQSQPSDITNASTKIVTGQAVHEFVMAQLGNLPIPAPGTDCADNTSSGTGGITSSNDKACALVLAYWSANDSPTGTAGVGLKWVPMAQTVSSGSSNQQSGDQG